MTEPRLIRLDGLVWLVCCVDSCREVAGIVQWPHGRNRALVTEFAADAQPTDFISLAVLQRAITIPVQSVGI